MITMKGFRTLLFNTLSGVAAAAGAILEQSNVIDLSPKTLLICIVVYSVINAWLRVKTDTPVGKATNG